MIFRLKRSAVPGEVPTSLEFGELAINYSGDIPILYAKNAAGEIVALNDFLGGSVGGSEAGSEPSSAEGSGSAAAESSAGNGGGSSGGSAGGTAYLVVTESGNSSFNGTYNYVSTNPSFGTGIWQNSSGYRIAFDGTEWAWVLGYWDSYSESFYYFDAVNYYGSQQFLPPDGYWDSSGGSFYLTVINP